eukprot:scaffold137409_cov401-Phaeocystis_antarctica.AAC.1
MPHEARTPQSSRPSQTGLLLTRFEPCFGQLGCATIIHPLNGMSKREWLMSTMYAGYLEHSGSDDLAGIAYGWEEA